MGKTFLKHFQNVADWGHSSFPGPKLLRESNRREVGVKGLAGAWNHLYTPNAGHQAVVLRRGSAGGGEGFTRRASMQFIVMFAWPGLWISIRARERGYNTHSIKGVLGLRSSDYSLSVPWLCLGACL